MMWLVIWNLNVLPVSILVYAIPLSLLECLGAAYICVRLEPGVVRAKQRARAWELT